MRQRLQKIYWTGILVTLVMALVTAAAAVSLRIVDTRNYLAAMLRASSEWTLDTNADFQSLADSIADSSPPLRAEFLLESGLIIADSSVKDPGETGSGPVQYDVPEITAAKRGETGSSLRISETGGSLILYMCQRVSPQLLLRLSYPVFETEKVLPVYGTLLILLFLVLYWLQRTEITKYALDQQRQLDDVRRLLDGETDSVKAVFPEYQPSLDSISYRIRRLQEDREEILGTLNMRNNFVANASHELRSPLTSVMGYAEMLEEDLAQTPEEKQLCLNMILGESRRMLAVIEDILRLGKAGNKEKTPSQPIRVSPVAEEVAQAFGQKTAKSGITISCCGDMKIKAEEKDIWEILYNLTDNAVRYGKQGGTVQILMSEGQLQVKDDGIGISPEHIGHIFEEFYRIDETRGNTAGGTGLGLSIVKAIVTAYGGRIDVESVYGQGSVFTVTFP